MYRIPLAFILLLFSLAISAQWRYGQLLPDTVIYSSTSISNTLYVGIDNNLVLNYQPKKINDSIVLISNNGRLFYDDTYTIVPHRAGSLRIEIHSVSGENIDTIGFCNFIVKPLPYPKVAFDTMVIEEHMSINHKSFINADSIYITITDDIPDSRNWVKIEEFSIGYSYGGYFIEESSGNNAITEAMKNLVATQGPGRIFSIKVITQSATSLLLTHPMYRVMFY